MYVLVVFFFKTRPTFVLSFSFAFGLLYNLASFLLGGAIGYFLFYLDYLLYPYLADKTDELGQKAECDYFSKKDFLTGVNFIMLNQDKMAFHTIKTAVNFVILIVLTFFVSSSSGSYLGSGAAYGLLFQFNYHMWGDYKNPAALNVWFSQIQKAIDPRYQRYFVFAVVILSVLISL